MDPYSQKLHRRFYDRGAATVARELIGKILVRRFRGREYRCRLIETEAYLGPHDLAAHSSKGRTRRTEVMFGEPGHAYVYLIYGIYQMLNFVVKGAGAVLIRGAIPLDGWNAKLTGPGLLARALHIRAVDNGVDLTGDDLFVLDNPSYRSRIMRTKRIGVEYAKEWKDRMLRFVDASPI